MRDDPMRYLMRWLGVMLVLEAVGVCVILGLGALGLMPHNPWLGALVGLAVGALCLLATNHLVRP
jgi:hypothetical protein